MSEKNEIEQSMVIQITMYIEIDMFKEEEKLINDCRRIHREGKDELIHHIIRESGSYSRYKQWEV